MEGALQRLKPHQEGLLLPIIQEYRNVSVKQKLQDGRVDFIASLVANDAADLSDESIMAVAIVSDSSRPSLSRHSLTCCVRGRT